MHNRALDRRPSMIVISKNDPKPGKKSFNITYDTKGVQLEVQLQENANLCRAG